MLNHDRGKDDTIKDVEKNKKKFDALDAKKN